MNFRLRLPLAAVMFLVIVSMMNSCKQGPEKIEVIQNYGTGELSRTYQTIDGKKEGLMVDYYPDGSLKGERWFENDIQVGKTTLYHKNGKVKEVQYYQDGKIHGGDTVFYESGQPEMVVTFDKGVKHGYVRKWSETDSLIFEAKYDHEVLVEVKGEPVNRDTLNKK